MSDVAEMMSNLNPCEMMFDVAFSNHDLLKAGIIEAEVATSLH
jgi:hypothetical protein